MKLVIEMEDATRYVPHDPKGRAYQYFVYDEDIKTTCPITKQEQRRLCFSGTKEQCERYVKNRTPTECCVCGDPMPKGKHPTWGWTCSHSCAREHYS